MKSGWITHKGKKIFYSDLTDFHTDVDALREELDAGDAIVCQQPKNSVLVVVDIRGTVGSSAVVKLFKISAERTKPYVRKAVVVGISGFRKVLLDAVSRFSNRDLVAINDPEAAKDWLLE